MQEEDLENWINPFEVKIKKLKKEEIIKIIDSYLVYKQVFERKIENNDNTAQMKAASVLVDLLYLHNIYDEEYHITVDEIRTKYKKEYIDELSKEKLEFYEILSILSFICQAERWNGGWYEWCIEDNTYINLLRRMEEIKNELNNTRYPEYNLDRYLYPEKDMDNNQKDNSDDAVEEKVENSPGLNMRHIRKMGKKYTIYKTINGKGKYYGSYKTLEEAIKRRDELVHDNWGLTFDEIPAPGRKGKYVKHIIFHDGVYKLNKIIDGKLRYIGSFKTVEEAKKLRDYLIENNWNLDLLPEDYLKDKRVHNIRKINDRYIVLKIDDDTKEVFGSFDTYEEAQEYLEYLIENNWQIDDEEEKVDEFVYYLNGEYIVRNVIDDEVKIFGKFTDIAEAIDFRNKCIMNNWKN